MKDDISEVQYGEGAVKVPAKVLVVNQSKEIGGKEIKRVMIGGVAIGDLLDEKRDKKNISHGIEMWEGEIVFIPKSKYRKNNTEPCFHGMQLDQMLMGSWQDGKYWDEKIFEKRPEGDRDGKR